MIIAVTGHRPPKIGGYDILNPTRVAVRDSIRDHLQSKVILYGAENLIAISGMALGVDQDFATAALDLCIPLHAYVPGSPEQQRSLWPPCSQRDHQHLLAQSSRIVTVPQSPAGYRQTLLDRNVAMMEAADEVLAVWDGSPGGTAHAVREARRLFRPITIITPIV